MNRPFAERLDVRELSRGFFDAMCDEASPGRGFGGHSMALALRAAQRTAPEGHGVHSLLARFLRPVLTDEPLLLQVTEDEGSRTFSRRIVTCLQQGKPRISANVTFMQADEAGLSFSMPTPASAPPHMLDEQRIGGVAVRHVEGSAVFDGTLAEPWRQRHWNRITEPLPDDPELHRCALVYLSDTTQLWLTLTANGIGLEGKGRRIASLEHSMWFHRPANAANWLLYDQTCPSTSGGTGCVQGNIFDTEGQTIASVFQTGILRPSSSQKCPGGAESDGNAGWEQADSNCVGRMLSRY